MSRSFRACMSVCAVVAAGVAVAVLPGSAGAADSTQVFPVGQTCSFALRVDAVGGNRHLVRDVVDRNGIPRTLSTGTGQQLTFTNLSTGAKLTLPATGAVSKTARDPATGLTTVTMTGANVLLLFPTDIPAGPSTTLYQGRVVFTTDDASNFTVLSTTGTSTDICAALS